jgi:hypothetical protein
MAASDAFGAAVILSPADAPALQRQIGNAALSDLLMRQRHHHTRPVHPVESRTTAAGDATTHDPGDANSVYVGQMIEIRGDRGRARREHDELIVAAARLRGAAESYANLWLTAASLALSAAPEPSVPDPTAQGNFLATLAGNMIWAATSLCPAWQMLVVPMSFAGAALGSGAAAGEPQQPPSIRGALGQHLARIRDHMVADAERRCTQWAETIVFEENLPDQRAQDRRLWDIIFPGVPFNNSERLRNDIAARLTSAVSQYTQQWQRWRTATAQPVQSSTTAGVFGPFAAIAGTVQQESEVAAARRRHPFVPHLTF